MPIAVWNGAVIASSEDTRFVEGHHYFPLDSVDEQYLRSSDAHTICPWKGKASYYSIEVDGVTNHDAAWFYPKPWLLGLLVKDRVAFWKGVEVSDRT